MTADITLVLTQIWIAGASDRAGPEQPNEDGQSGRFEFRLTNFGPDPVSFTRFCYASMTRPGRKAVVTGATMTDRVANHVELTPDTPVVLARGASWEVIIDGLTHAPLNFSQGAMAAWVETAEGPRPVRCEGLRAGAAPGPRKCWPQGRVTSPLGLLPWPRDLAVTAWQPARPFSPAQADDGAAFEVVAALHQRLFPSDPPALTHGGGVAVTTEEDATLSPGAYRLEFAQDRATLAHADADGQRHGLVALAQIAHAAQTDTRFQLPAAGVISDAPRFGWRGTHIDVARNVRPMAQLHRLADILAWHRMNQLHLHLTDDEAWRLESRAFPDLARVASQRARDTTLPPQYADGLGGQSGFYTHAEMAGLIAHAEGLGITITPEIDLPGHTYALMAAIDGLRDPDEPWDCYRSIQGYPNNALNPALPRCYEVVETLLDEVCALFPGPIVHVGGDEVDGQAWAQSPAAQALREAEGLAEGAMPLQAHFLRRVQAMIQARGKQMGGWDECAEGGGVAREGTVLFAWRDLQKTAELLAEGYDVIATPGQAYYLDMIQGAGWDEPGTSWAGAVPPEQSYTYEPTEGLPDGPGRLLGVQGGIWSEHLNSTARWNYMVFPRLSAIAEAGWTPPEAKDWPRFCALSRLMPQL